MITALVLGAAVGAACGYPGRLHVASAAGGVPICIEPGHLSPAECEQPDIRCVYLESYSFGLCVRVSFADSPYALRYVCAGKNKT